MTAWIVAHQLPLSMGFSRQEHWGGPLCLPPGDIPSPGMQPASLCFLIGRQVLYHYLPRAESKRQESHLKKNIYFNWRLIILQFCGGFLPYINMNWPKVHMCPPPPILSPRLISLPTLSLWIVSLSALLLAMNLPWSSILHVVIYMFQFYSKRVTF